MRDGHRPPGKVGVYEGDFPATFSYLSDEGSIEPPE